MIGPDVIDDERGIPAPGIRRTNRTRRAVFAGLGLVTVVGVIGVFWWQLGTAGAPAEAASGTEMDLVRTSAATFPDPMAVKAEEPTLEDVLALIESEPEPTVHVPPPIPLAAKVAPPLPEEADPEPRVLDKSAQPIQLASNDAGAEPTQAGTAPQPGTGFRVADDGTADSARARGELAERLTPTRLEATSAGRLADRSLMITRGTMIDAVLSTRIVSALSGMVTARVTRNVYSDDGRVLIFARGDTVTGEYQSNVQHGTRRVFVLWSRVKSGDVVVDLDSPATDALGATGIPGDVDNHFWPRFGGAIMVSLVDDVASAAAANAAPDGDGTQVNVGGSINSGSRVIEEVLSQTINIPPTVSVHQGARVGIFVARDLDFRSVYRVRAR